jgi:hypothetical protein
MNRSGIWNVLDRTFADHAYKFDQHDQFFAALWPHPDLIMPLAHQRERHPRSCHVVGGAAFT